MLVDSEERTSSRITAKQRRRQRRRLFWIAVACCALLLVAVEVRTSWVQSHLFSNLAARLTYSVEPGRDPEFRHPHSGPYDIRLGHSRLTEFFERLGDANWEVTAQARGSDWHRRLMDWGLAPIYAEKTSAGLRLLDRQDQPLFESRWPERIYASFEAAPEVIVRTLLFIENREMLDTRQGNRNPAVEWDRLANAALDFSLSKVSSSRPVSGGSTLATQLEKLRHSPGGLTRSVSEKSRQMLSASLRAYLQGRETTGARRQIVRDYLNSVPLAAMPGYGEVYGLGDGLTVWFDAEFDQVNRLLADPDQHPPAEVARAYRQALTLLLAIRRPTQYLVEDPTSLERRVTNYLPLLAEAGVISHRLRELAAGATVDRRRRYIPN
ncbi:MAG: glycosyl transferase family 51, partial [bacterium]|nr:glycosyl transferase family 51 [bacterium]